MNFWLCLVKTLDEINIRDVYLLEKILYRPAASSNDLKR